jgi:hypothetical protein
MPLFQLTYPIYHDYAGGLFLRFQLKPQLLLYSREYGSLAGIGRKAVFAPCHRRDVVGLPFQREIVPSFKPRFVHDCSTNLFR